MEKIEHLQLAEDDTVVVQALQGDDTAFELLVERYLDTIYRQTQRYMGTQADAEDATQEVFVKIWQNLKKYDTAKSFRNWAIEITKNTCLDLLKKKQVISFTYFETVNGLNPLMETLRDNEPLPDRATDRTLLKEATMQAQRGLSATYNEVLNLYYKDGLNFREIAELLRTPLHTIKSRHRRGVHLLKGLLARYIY